MFSKRNQTIKTNDFHDLEKQLGADAKLGVSALLLDANGCVQAECGYGSVTPMPMASTKKIATAIVIMKKILDEKTLQLTDVITFQEEDFVPGLLNNPLDKYFYDTSGDYPQQVKTIAELIKFMLTKSDNTAADKLLALAGGPDPVNGLMRELGIDGYHLKRSTSQLLEEYYGFESVKNKQNCQRVRDIISKDVFVRHAAEFTMFTNGDDCCTPAAMTKLLQLLHVEAAKPQHDWLSAAANYICGVMKACETGGNRIKKGVENIPGIVAIGNKTGSLGGIANDTAFIEFENQQCVVLTISTSLSALDINQREAVMQKVAAMSVGYLQQYALRAQHDQFVQQFEEAKAIAFGI